MKRSDCLAAVYDDLCDCAVVTIMGAVAVELYALGHRANFFYMEHSMGLAPSIGLGIALTQPRRKVVVLDGDGAALMKMGTLATIGTARPQNLVHVIIDNEAHESTGGQETVSGGIDFATVAAGCGYRTIWRVDTPEALQAAAREAANGSDGPVLINAKVAIGSAADLGRPGLTPPEVKEQFMAWLAA